ncbi:Holo-[acyl-carrier protein] synthase, belongs to 4-phosphopantetheinyl transferase superfamily [Bifidobacterium actinocoloniiforme DSM 22766]|uniref:Holo-[acyl-carrier protein] synthase, belongs to 4-phosphopantetheinyl transferase superfamily n=2 Tax=Bifidobacterium actinocoloniiforme TaxID=638619 RepID=A0A086YYI2_9BIFI|nr:hypothetical protein AB656_06640 [Bifidobacterium actinocoloniiforme DSM 22766]KFI39332.1 Holo-[acyl-carrier protein] synthase, belongs to 4-phosphopantetheinyl transferase superfamily [Bifidobacterium actinocoloniiforme DSM 22766]
MKGKPAWPGGPAPTRLLGLGHDIVSVEPFAQQLAEPGSRMRDLFSPREQRQCAERSRFKGDSEAVHLSARWAGKESVVKAWSAALGPRPAPYTLDDFPWAGIEILDDSRSRPGVYLADEVRDRLCSSLELTAAPIWRISLSHDGGLASAAAALVVW